ncbi:MAG: IclR family transcriptional regulator [Alphaproteobacteria bacterium]|nr:IclR family transcriptional regulator [Rhodospirillaceae bacterium]MDG2479442.1 IclR family transcriptional regulator [Alphaproteobacteria bacterium]
MAVSSIVSKASAMLDVICASTTPLSFTRIMTQTGFARSSTHRVLSTLLEERLVAHDTERQTYQPGPRLVGWAVSTLQAGDLANLAAAMLDDLGARTGAHIALAILDGTSALYLRTIDSFEPYRRAPRVGERSPLHGCAVGKAMLAFLAPNRRDALLEDIELERLTEHTITDAEAFRAELEDVRETGIAVCDREELLQVVGLAAPVFGHGGDVVAAVSIWNMIERQDLAALKKFRDELFAATSTLSARLGAEVSAVPAP